MVTQGHMANEEGKKSAERVMSVWVLFLMPCPPPSPGEDQDPLALEPVAFAVIFIFFPHISY